MFAAERRLVDAESCDDVMQIWNISATRSARKGIIQSTEQLRQLRLSTANGEDRHGKPYGNAMEISKAPKCPLLSFVPTIHTCQRRTPTALITAYASSFSPCPQPVYHNYVYQTTHEKATKPERNS